MTQASSVNFDLWPEYLKYVASCNKKIKQRNKKDWASIKKEEIEFDKKIEKQNVAIDKLNKKNAKRFQELQDKWDRQPWYKKMFGDERPWLRPIKRQHIFSYCPMIIPFPDPPKEPSVEEYLTWYTTSHKHKN